MKKILPLLFFSSVTILSANQPNTEIVKKFIKANFNNAEYTIKDVNISNIKKIDGYDWSTAEMRLHLVDKQGKDTKIGKQIIYVDFDHNLSSVSLVDMNTGQEMKLLNAPKLDMSKLKLSNPVYGDEKSKHKVVIFIDISNYLNYGLLAQIMKDFESHINHKHIELHIVPIQATQSKESEMYAVSLQAMIDNDKNIIRPSLASSFFSKIAKSGNYKILQTALGSKTIDINEIKNKIKHNTKIARDTVLDENIPSMYIDGVYDDKGKKLIGLMEAEMFGDQRKRVR